MRIIECKNYEEMSKAAAGLVAAQVSMKPDCVLGLATGSTPEGMYKCLCEMNRKGEIDFSGVTSVNLDEYYPIEPTNDQSYRYFMNYHLFDHVNIDKKNTYVPDGTAKSGKREAARYDKLIETLGGVDLQILGIGQNGHIGFNEPGKTLDPATHLTVLTESTIKANSRFFKTEDDVPKQALTMGIKPILTAKMIVIMASGRNKADAVKKMLKGKLDLNCPASLLYLHTNVVLVADKDALGE